MNNIMSKRRRLTAIAVAAAIVVSAILVVVARRPTVIEVTIAFDVCTNPSLTVDGRDWKTDDKIPESWTSAPTQGQLEIKGETATFIGPNDVRLSYFDTTGQFTDLVCYLGPSQG